MSSHPSDIQVPSDVDGQANDFAGATRTVDWTGYPTLFQRDADRIRARRTTVQSDSEPMRAARSGRDIREAFLGYCQAMLLTPDTAGRFDRPSERSAAVQTLAATEAFGFTREEIRRIGCGLYPGAAAVREHLRGVGFSDAEIDAANLVCDEAGRPRAELAGSLIVPLADDRGRTRDYLLVAIDHRQSTFASYRYLFGTVPSEIVAHGLQAALSRPSSRSALVLVEDVLDCLLLHCRGIHGVVAIGGRGREISPRRWEQLASMGVTTVTLAFRQDGRHAMNVRDALVNALRARTAPEVHVADSYPAGEESPLDVLRRFGRETCATAITNRTLAFHDKDFGAVDRESDLPETSSEAFEEPYYRTAFRQHLAELIAALPAEHRPAHAERVAACDDAIRSADWERLHRLADHLGTRNGWNGWHDPSSPSTAMCTDAATILERLGEELRSERRFRPATGTVNGDRIAAMEWLVHDSPSRRLEMLCERILDTCETDPGRQLLIACREHTKEEIMLALTARMARSVGNGHGPTAEEIRRRLSGSMPRVGNPDRPWFIDEAVERLRGWSHRLSFVDCRDADGASAILQRAANELASTTRIALFLDGWSRASGTKLAQTDWLRSFERPICASTDSPPVVGSSPGVHDIPASEAQIRQVLADWEQRELEEAQV